ncbi:hypothetical protein [Cupriavidus sp. AcVe19-6a]|uniref:hypothetical protein n=1 Tax=Cupriavidus sp. AcVe19-6a TaxID=2821358 RepID=UPI001AE72260|nr:hypothetical protein [Cupriavidus sp. AcVe19-6a]MBP0637976.1 hypothetical protein [Cupriavidus sp. AcVe19-6a]
MAKKQPIDCGFFTAGNDQYHGVQSIKENGALEHANRLARILLREKKVATEEEALSLASREVQRLRWNIDGFQANRMAREELRRELGSQRSQSPRGRFAVS